jgi:magnesium-transporting ATPase (P-type)
VRFRAPLQYRCCNGKKGTEIAKDAADLILVDDDLSK